MIFTLVTPAEAGVQLVYLIVLMDIRERYWIPAYAGMTACEVFILIHRFPPPQRRKVAKMSQRMLYKQ